MRLSYARCWLDSGAGCGIEILERAAKLHIPGARLTKFELAEGLVLTLKSCESVGHRRVVA
jgi:hypothetical protein